MNHWQDFKVGDIVVYTGKYITLSVDLINKIGTVRKIDYAPEMRDLGRPLEDTILVVVFNFNGKQDERGVFAANCELYKRPNPTWEL